MINACKTVFSKYATFEGRADRREFWGFLLARVLLSLLLATAILTSVYWQGIYSTSAWIAIGITAAISFALFIPTIAVTIRRLHDVGKSGYWVFINLIPIIGTIWFWILMLSESDSSNQYDNCF